MTIPRFPLTAKLAAIQALLGISLVALVAVAWRHLPSSDEALEAAQLGKAQRATQNADMLRDALHADLLAAMLAADESADSRTQVQRSVRANAQEFRGEFAKLDSMTLGPALRPQIASAREAGLAYVQEVERLVLLALSNPGRAAAQRAGFQEYFEKAKTELAAQTELISRQIDASNAEIKTASDNARRWLLLAALLTVAGGWVGVALVARSIRNSLMDVGDVAREVAGGNLDRRSDQRGRDEVGQIASSVNLMADELSKMISRTRAEADRSAFNTKLMTALDMADDEKQACQMVERAMGQISPGHAMELLLSDSSDAHFARAAQHPLKGAPGCTVESPFACVAVRRGHTVSFEDSEALDACPKLRGRTDTNIMATCVPVTFMGRALGVVHAVGSASEPLSAEAHDRLNTLGTQIGSRIGSVRAFESTQLQARTDPLTGLVNRRAVEHRMRELLRSREIFAFVMADLDHFKLLNDTHGHQAGDEALRVFADATRECVRQSDVACRWGGEEFCFVLVNSDAEQAMKWVDRVRSHLARQLQLRAVPAYTASFGVVDSTTDLPLESMVAAADMALYRAKSEGRDRGVRAIAEDFGGLVKPIRKSEARAAVDPKILAESSTPEIPEQSARLSRVGT